MRTPIKWGLIPLLLILCLFSCSLEAKKKVIKMSKKEYEKKQLLIKKRNSCKRRGFRFIKQKCTKHKLPGGPWVPKEEEVKVKPSMSSTTRKATTTSTTTTSTTTTTTTTTPKPTTTTTTTTTTPKPTTTKRVITTRKPTTTKKIEKPSKNQKLINRLERQQNRVDKKEANGKPVAEKQPVLQNGLFDGDHDFDSVATTRWQKPKYIADWPKLSSNPKYDHDISDILYDRKKSPAASLLYDAIPEKYDNEENKPSKKPGNTGANSLHGLGSHFDGSDYGADSLNRQSNSMLASLYQHFPGQGSQGSLFDNSDYENDFDYNSDNSKPGANRKWPGFSNPDRHEDDPCLEIFYNDYKQYVVDEEIDSPFYEGYENPEWQSNVYLGCFFPRLNYSNYFRHRELDCEGNPIDFDTQGEWWTPRFELDNKDRLKVGYHFPPLSYNKEDAWNYCNSLGVKGTILWCPKSKKENDYVWYHHPNHPMELHDEESYGLWTGLYRGQDNTNNYYCSHMPEGTTAQQSMNTDYIWKHDSTFLPWSIHSPQFNSRTDNSPSNDIILRITQPDWNDVRWDEKFRRGSFVCEMSCETHDGPLVTTEGPTTDFRPFTFPYNPEDEELIEFDCPGRSRREIAQPAQERVKRQAEEVKQEEPEPMVSSSSSISDLFMSMFSTFGNELPDGLDSEHSWNDLATTTVATTTEENFGTTDDIGDGFVTVTTLATTTTAFETENPDYYRGAELNELTWKPSIWSFDRLFCDQSMITIHHSKA